MASRRPEAPDLDLILRANPEYVDDLYRRYVRDPESVGTDWASFFAGFQLGSNGHGLAAAAPAAAEPTVGVFDLVHSYRELGHLVADLDPLGHNQTEHPLLVLGQFGFDQADLDRVVACPSFLACDRAPLRQLVELLRQTYCRTLGVEYMHISDVEQRTWLQEQMEPTLNRPDLSADDRKHIFMKLVASTGLEEFLQTKYVGQKRFSLEGAESLIPMLDAFIERAGDAGIEEIVMGMSHRGRLNVLANILGKPYEMIFSEFEGSFLPADVQGDGDVKYHLGYARDHETRSGRKIHVSLLSNPSHLEAIDPVVEGIVRAKQRSMRDMECRRVMPLLIHGDAAFTGQGIVAETLALSELRAYRTGGSIHIIINNQIGFTTSPEDYRFTRYPSDVAKIIQAPVFHVNGNDPEAAVQAARLAAAFRDRFKVDVIIDLVCYRKHGHNEVDDPTFTQPVLYEEIARQKPVRDLYAARLAGASVLSEQTIGEGVAEYREIFDNALDYARDFMPRQQVFTLGGVWKGFTWAGADWSAQTAVSAEVLERVVDGARRQPQGFTPHPKAHKLYEERAAMVHEHERIDWSCAEMLAFGSLLLEGTNVRLSGQDSGRGTFSQRHAVLYDHETNERHVPLAHLDAEQGWFLITDSMLSEAAALGFEYGFASADPRNLVIWEAQFGDFINGAQIAVDQFIASAESKWQRMNGLVLLLPHGYEGQGPEHSSARLERFLQLAAEDNLQICNLTTPAQYFHALRRQIHRTFRKPLVLMSPKSLLRHKLAVSPLEELTAGAFRTVLLDPDPIDAATVRRVLLCSGKIFYELLTARRERDVEHVAIVRVEQLYPFPANELGVALHAFPSATEVDWVQEEPWNMGAWHFVRCRLEPLLGEHQKLEYVGRDEAASPATGSYKVHQKEQSEVIDRALRRFHER